MMSDESENDGVYVESYENDIYYKKYKLLLEQCEVLQKQNETLVHRIQQIKRVSKRRQTHVDYIRNKLLNEHGEDWPIIPKQILTLEEVDVKPTYPSVQQMMIKEEKPDPDLPRKTSQVLEVEEKPVKPAKKPTKRKGSRLDKDPNAPKRPSNPFFQFCQEQRQILMEQINSELKPGETEPTKQELTRQLALKWKSLSGQDKQVYVDMYERSKEKYAVEMSEYNMKK